VTEANFTLPTGRSAEDITNRQISPQDIDQLDEHAVWRREHLLQKLTEDG
jgi:hypothetical protein